MLTNTVIVLGLVGGVMVARAILEVTETITNTLIDIVSDYYPGY